METSTNLPNDLGSYPTTGTIGRSFIYPDFTSELKKLALSEALKLASYNHLNLKTDKEVIAVAKTFYKFLTSK